MRVLYVNQTAQVSGAERSLLALLRRPRPAVERVVACSCRRAGRELAERGIARQRIVGTQASFRLHPMHTSRGMAEIGRSAIEVRRLAARLGADLLHANTTSASLIWRSWRGAERAAGAGSRPRLGAPGSFSRFVLGLIGRRADFVVANSDIHSPPVRRFAAATAGTRGAQPGRPRPLRSPRRRPLRGEARARNPRRGGGSRGGCAADAVEGSGRRSPGARRTFRP